MQPNAIRYVATHAAAGAGFGWLVAETVAAWIASRYPLAAGASLAAAPIAGLIALACAGAAVLAWQAPPLLRATADQAARLRAAIFVGAILLSVLLCALSLGQATTPLLVRMLPTTPAGATAHAAHWLVAGLVLAQVIGLGALLGLREHLAPATASSRWDRLGYAALARSAP